MAGTIRCPKCKQEQPKQPICSRCGFDIRAYALKLQKQRTAGAPPAAAKATPSITCPKCKTRQTRQPICSKCGFDIRAYVLKMKQRAAAQTQQTAAQSKGPAPQPPQRPTTLLTRPAAQPAKPAVQPAGPAPQQSRSEVPPRTPDAQKAQKPVPNLAALEALRQRVVENATVSEGLLSVSALFSETWEIYKNRFVPLIVLYLLSAVFAMIPTVLFVGGAIGLSTLVPELRWILIIAAAIIGVTLSLVGMCWGLAALTAGTVNERMGIRDSLGHGWDMLWAYIWLISLAWYVISGAMMLLFIPGLIFMVWAFPSQFVLFTEGERGMDALLKSREYVRGYWMDTFIKLFIIWSGMVVAGFIPFGQVVYFPFMMVYMFRMFLNLRRIKGSVVIFSTSFKEKLLWIGTGTLGLVLPIVLIVMMAGPAITNSFQVIKQAIETGGLQLQEGFSPGGVVSKGLVKPSKDVYVQGEEITVQYVGFPGNQRDWITIVDAESSDSTYGQWFYTRGSKEGVHTFSGLSPGSYEIRVYFDWPDGGHTVQDRYRITITPRPSTQ